jgi:hypothetical protein
VPRDDGAQTRDSALTTRHGDDVSEFPSQIRPAKRGVADLERSPSEAPRPAGPRPDRAKLPRARVAARTRTRGATPTRTRGRASSSSPKRLCDLGRRPVGPRALPPRGRILVTLSETEGRHLGGCVPPAGEPRRPAARARALLSSPARVLDSRERGGRAPRRTRRRAARAGSQWTDKAKRSKFFAGSGSSERRQVRARPEICQTKHFHVELSRPRAFFAAHLYPHRVPSDRASPNRRGHERPDRFEGGDDVRRMLRRGGARPDEDGRCDLRDLSR